MSSDGEISFVVDTTDPTVALGFEVWVDDQKFGDCEHIQTAEKFSFTIPDADSEHELRLVLKNKTQDHTVVDKSGNIIKDACLVIKDIAFDKINLGFIANKESVYTHNFNGAGETTVEKFYGQIGCNGTVSLKFSTPLYLWILEHM
jgi:hypothetical protein